MSKKQHEFLEEELPRHLEPGETVLMRGVAEDPIRWVFATLTLGLLSFRRIFYYVVLTDRRLLCLKAPRKRYFGFTPLPRFWFSAGLQVTEVRALNKDQLAKVELNRQSPAHLLLGWRSMRILDKEDQALSLFITRKAAGFPRHQSSLYNDLVPTLVKSFGVKTVAVGK